VTLAYTSKGEACESGRYPIQTATPFFLPEMGMVVPDHKLPLPIIVLTHAEGRIFQDKKTMDVIEPLRTDLLPRHHAA
jgi:hypothetical protein